MRRVALVDPGSGNLASVRRAVERAAEGAVLVEITREAETLRQADAIILPGQGAFAACRAGLDALDGMVAALYEAVQLHGRPMLGICVGMQLLAQKGLEHGETPGLAWLPGVVAPMDPRAPDGSPLPLPQMGWNALAILRPHPVLAGIADGDHAYFVHSYSWVGAEPGDLLATTDYGGPVTAVIGRGTVVATQFHAEKSAALGLTLLRNFLAWRP